MAAYRTAATNGHTMVMLIERQVSEPSGAKEGADAPVEPGIVEVGRRVAREVVGDVKGGVEGDVARTDEQDDGDEQPRAQRKERAVLDPLKAQDRVPEQRPEQDGDDADMAGRQPSQHLGALTEEAPSVEELEDACEAVAVDEQYELPPADGREPTDGMGDEDEADDDREPASDNVR